MCKILIHQNSNHKSIEHIQHTGEKLLSQKACIFKLHTSSLKSHDSLSSPNIYTNTSCNINSIYFQYRKMLNKKTLLTKTTLISFHTLNFIIVLSTAIQKSAKLIPFHFLLPLLLHQIIKLRYFVISIWFVVVVAVIRHITNNSHTLFCFMVSFRNSHSDVVVNFNYYCQFQFHLLKCTELREKTAIKSFTASYQKQSDEFGSDNTQQNE